jgi:hypothetical protein
MTTGTGSRWSSPIDAFERYNEHAGHVRFVYDRWLSEVSDFFDLDYAARQTSRGGGATHV